MATKSVMEDGIRWSIGNGDKVRIWNDKWIHNHKTYKIMTPINPLMFNDKVSALIDNERAVWKSELVNSIFLPHEALAILAIPLSSTLPEDRRLWMKALWKSIWKLHCPKKIRKFIWRAGKDILPTKTKLKDCKIPVEVECDLCGGVETTGHTFWSGDLAAAVWQMANVKAPALMANPSNFLDLFWSVMEAKPDQDLKAFATIAWFLWNNQNAVRHGKSSRTTL
nr:uncharacterized protein LOC111994135 [Quercus suber]